MMIGHAAGTVASLAITSELKQGIQKIDVDLLHVHVCVVEETGNGVRLLKIHV